MLSHSSVYFKGGLKLSSATTAATIAAPGVTSVATAPLQLGTAKATAPACLTLGSAAATTAASGLKLGGKY